MILHTPPDDGKSRPRRYPRDAALSSIVDQLTERAEHFEAIGDRLAAAFLRLACALVLAVAIGFAPGTIGASVAA